MNFKQWLEEGAREDNRFRHLDDRVKFGKEIESRILNSLTSQGWVIKPVSTNADKYDKVDGLIEKAPVPIPTQLPAYIQVKYRDTGNDLLMEVVWKFDGDRTLPLEKMVTGRDMYGKSQIYASLDQAGNTIRIRSATEAKDICKQLLFGLMQSNQSSFRIGRNEIRIVNDPRDQRMKINAFLSPESFNWKIDYPISQNIWEKPAKDNIPSLPHGITAAVIAHIEKALEQGASSFPVPNNMKKVKEIEKFVKRKGLSVNVANGQVILKKVA